MTFTLCDRELVFSPTSPSCLCAGLIKWDELGLLYRDNYFLASCPRQVSNHLGLDLEPRLVSTKMEPCWLSQFRRATSHQNECSPFLLPSLSNIQHHTFSVQRRDFICTITWGGKNWPDSADSNCTETGAGDTMWKKWPTWGGIGTNCIPRRSGRWGRNWTKLYLKVSNCVGIQIIVENCILIVKDLRGKRGGGARCKKEGLSERSEASYWSASNTTISLTSSSLQLAISSFHQFGIKSVIIVVFAWL